MITKLRIRNFRIFNEFEIALDQGVNLIVGDNEAGKSTILQAIDLVMSGKQFGRPILDALNVHWINAQAANTYVADLHAGAPSAPPEVLIEAHFGPTDEVAAMVGMNHSGDENCPGIRLRIFLDPECEDEYQAFLQNSGERPTVPVEFYTYEWKDFSGEPIPPHRKRPYKSVLIDPRLIRLQAGTDFYLRDVISGSLSTQERAQMALVYRQARHAVGASSTLRTVNEVLQTTAGEITDKPVNLAMDETQAATWEASLVPHLDGVPMTQIGQGEQSSLKMMLAMVQQTGKSNVILIEEPENNLSHTRLNVLLSRISARTENQQIVIATHSSYVLNKLDISRLKLLHHSKCITFDGLSKQTSRYFRKLSGYDTLRLICAKAAILVEGPSDELIVQRAYRDLRGKLPIEDGVDVIDVRALAFKRFIELAELLSIRVAVVTDNDGNEVHEVRSRYLAGRTLENVLISVGSNDCGETLEDQLISAAGRETLNAILGRDFDIVDDLAQHMKRNKTETAIDIFDSAQSIQYPTYINEAIDFVSG